MEGGEGRIKEFSVHISLYSPNTTNTPSQDTEFLCSLTQVPSRPPFTTLNTLNFGYGVCGTQRACRPYHTSSKIFLFQFMATLNQRGQRNQNNGDNERRGLGGWEGYQCYLNYHLIKGWIHSDILVPERARRLIFHSYKLSHKDLRNFENWL